MLTAKQLIMGFGHRVYTVSDPRSDIIKSWAQKLSASSDDGHLYPISERIEQVMRRRKSIFPEFGFLQCSGLSFHGHSDRPVYADLCPCEDSGWTAHIIEQRENNRLIRPIAAYIGPDQLDLASVDQTKDHMTKRGD